MSIFPLADVSLLDPDSEQSTRWDGLLIYIIPGVSSKKIPETGKGKA
jgi:hypothetical protein